MKSSQTKFGSLTDYQQQGFFIAKTPFAPRLAQIRKKLISIFNEVARAHKLKPIKTDADIDRLYHSKHRDLWVAAYDQLRYLPEVMALASHPMILKIIAQAGIKFANTGARPILRADMPRDPDFDFPPHQDYVFNQGSLNCLTLWIPFQNIDHSIGPVGFIPGSHLAGHAPSKNGLLDSFDEIKIVEGTMKLGEVLVFSQFLHHRSGKNMSKKIRFSLQFRINDLAEKAYALRKYYLNQNITEKTFDVLHETYFPKNNKYKK